MENSENKTEGEERPGAEIVLENTTLSAAADKTDEKIGENEQQNTSDDDYFTAGSSASGDESTGDRTKKINFSELMGIENAIIEPCTSELTQVRAIETESSSISTSNEEESTSSNEEEESPPNRESSGNEESDTSGEVEGTKSVDKTDSRITNDLLDGYGSDMDLCGKENQKVEVIISGFDRRFHRITERVDHLLERMNEVVKMDVLRMQMFVSKYETIILDTEELKADITSLQNMYEAKLGEEFQVHSKASRITKKKPEYRTIVWNLKGLKAEVMKMKSEFQKTLKFVLLYIESEVRNHELEMKLSGLESQKCNEHFETLGVETSSDDEVQVLYENRSLKQEKLHKINILSGKGRNQRLKYSWTSKTSDKKYTLAGLDLVAEVMYRNFNASFKKESSPNGMNPNISSIYLTEEKLIKMKARDREHLFKVMENNGFKSESEQMIPLLLEDLKKKSKTGCLGFIRKIFKFKS